jgi:hypothetical protein
MVCSSLALGVTVIKKIVLVLALVLTAAAAFAVHEIGFSNIVGMIRYDRRREGTLHVGDRAPDVALRALVSGDADQHGALADSRDDSADLRGAISDSRDAAGASRDASGASRTALVDARDAPDDTRPIHLLDALRGKPLVLVFGSYT